MSRAFTSTVRCNFQLYALFLKAKEMADPIEREIAIKERVKRLIDLGVVREIKPA